VTSPSATTPPAPGPEKTHEAGGPRAVTGSPAGPIPTGGVVSIRELAARYPYRIAPRSLICLDTA
jgi:hypothetical protein